MIFFKKISRVLKNHFEKSVFYPLKMFMGRGSTFPTDPKASLRVSMYQILTWVRIQMAYLPLLNCGHIPGQYTVQASNNLKMINYAYIIKVNNLIIVVKKLLRKIKKKNINYCKFSPLTTYPSSFAFIFSQTVIQQ